MSPSKTLSKTPDAALVMTDAGFATDAFAPGFIALEAALAGAGAPDAGVEIAPDDDLARHRALLLAAPAIRVTVGRFDDGRAFTTARALRLMGFRGRLRAGAGLIADQYAMARRAGFDEVEVAPEIAARQPEADWLMRADWRAYDHQSRLRG